MALTSLLKCLAYEARAGAKMAQSSISQKDRSKRRVIRQRLNCLILPGFFAPRLAYLHLAVWLESLGLRVKIADFGSFNRPRLSRQVVLLRNEVDSFLSKIGAIDIVIGHSLGGLEAVSILGDHPKVKKVFAINSPFSQGNPWRIVEIGAQLFIGVPALMQRELLRQLIQQAGSEAHKIVTISTIYDRLVSPCQAAFPGAKNVIVEKIKGASNGESPIYRTHTGLPNSAFVRNKIILPELLSL